MAGGGLEAAVDCLSIATSIICAAAWRGWAARTVHIPFDDWAPFVAFWPQSFLPGSRAPEFLSPCLETVFQTARA